MKTKFYLKRPDSKTSTVIEARFRYSGKELKYSTGISIEPNNWQSDRSKGNYQKAISSKAFPQGYHINRQLGTIQEIAESVFYSLKNEDPGSPISNEDFKAALDVKLGRQQIETTTILSLYERFISDLPKGISQNTVKAHRTSLSKLKTYYNKHKAPILQKITVQNLKEYVNHLIESGLKANSIGKEIKNIKAVLNYANETSLSDTTVHKSKQFQRKEEDSFQIYLTNKELDKIQALDLAAEALLEKARDMFLIGAYTGLRFSDFSKLTRSDIGLDGNIKVFAQKTKQKVVIPIHSNLKPILDRYKDQLPQMTQQKFNQRIKLVCAKVDSLKHEIEDQYTVFGNIVREKKPKFEKISSHTARRSFASNLYLEGVPVLTIMAITGHESESSFRKYIKLNAEEHARLLRKHQDSQMKIA